MKKVVLGLGLIAFIIFGVAEIQKASAEKLSVDTEILTGDKDPAKDKDKDKDKDKKKAKDCKSSSKCKEAKKPCGDKKMKAPCCESKGSKSATKKGSCKPKGKNI